MSLIKKIDEFFEDNKFLEKLYSKKKDKFLKYHYKFLLESYVSESIVYKNIPYYEEVCWIKDEWKQTHNFKIKIEKADSIFKLESSELANFQNEALKERNPTNSKIIRLNAVKKDNEKTTLIIQQAEYFDQAKSNLAMDWDTNHSLKKMGFDTLRSYFLSVYGNRLPNLNDKRLANTIGISVILFYEKEGRYIPYLPRRSAKSNLAVFTGGEYHCTASGALEWDDAQNDFNGIFTEDMYREIVEEVAIYQSEIQFMQPVALCREFLRGGKPQVFYAGITILSENEIKERRKIAIKNQAEKGEPIEVEDEQLGFTSMDELPEQIKEHFISLEAHANLYYAEKYIRQYDVLNQSYKIAISYLKKRDYQKALDYFNETLELEPEYADAFNFRAECYINLKYPNLAIEDIKKSNQLYKKTQGDLAKTKADWSISKKKLRVEKNKVDEKIKQNESLQNRMQKLVEQFTHSLGNIIFPDTIYQVAERLKNLPECRRDTLLLHEAYHAEIIIKLQAELLRQRYSNTNPEKFRLMIRNCRRNANAGEKTKTIEAILNYAVSRVTARFLNQHYAGLETIRNKILTQTNTDLNQLKQKFEDDILLHNSLSPLEWVSQNLRPIQITQISPLWKKVFILSDSYAEALLFGYFSEILFNAFKYADHESQEFLTLSFAEQAINDDIYLSCNWSNPTTYQKLSGLGTNQGLEAIAEDLKQLNDSEKPEESLLIYQQDNQFQVTLFFKKDLLINEMPVLTIKRKNREISHA